MFDRGVEYDLLCGSDNPVPYNIRKVGFAMKAVIVGYGGIGKTVAKKLKEDGWDVAGMVRSHGLCDASGEHIKSFSPDNLGEEFHPEKHMLFVALPSASDGGVAFDYIMRGLKLGMKVVTCEKGALASRYLALKGYIEMNRLGFSATVGGGTQMLHPLKRRLLGRNDVAFHVFLNGTLNFIFHSMSHDGDSLSSAVQKAQKLAYAEPGASSDLEVVNGEIGDTLLKTQVMCNVCVTPEKPLFVSPDTAKTLSDQELATLVHQARHRRYIVSFFPPNSKNGENIDTIAGFKIDHEGWRIRAGFQRTDTDPVLATRLPTGVNNALITYDGRGGQDGVYVLANGPGAGPDPTASAMLCDARWLMQA